jgi:uncharacterized membrane protein (GlpM family)
LRTGTFAVAGLALLIWGLVLIYHFRVITSLKGFGVTDASYWSLPHLFPGAAFLGSIWLLKRRRNGAALIAAFISLLSASFILLIMGASRAG